VVLAAGAIFIVGVIDDVREMSAPAKIAGQVLAASILYFLGVNHVPVQDPPGRGDRPTPALIPLITAAWSRPHQRHQPDRRPRRLAAGVVAIAGGALAIYHLRPIQGSLDLGL